LTCCREDAERVFLDLRVLSCRSRKSLPMLDLTALRGGKRLVTRRSCPFEGHLKRQVSGRLVSFIDSADYELDLPHQSDRIHKNIRNVKAPHVCW
jgi:hypothetical protein